MDNPRTAQYRGYMEKMLKQNTEKNYILEFNSTESMYKEQAKLDVDENPETPGKYQIRGIPTMILFNNGSSLFFPFLCLG